MSKHITIPILKYYDEKTKEYYLNSFERIKYEIFDTPKGTLVNYYEKEIRIMCPYNTKWEGQDVVGIKDENYYYIELRAYAPNNATKYKNGLSGNIINIDPYGRKYISLNLPVASYNKKTNVWTYLGVESTAEEYIGWDYMIEWYDSDGIILESNYIRINLANENCVNIIEPYYLSNMKENLKTYIDNQINIKVENILQNEELTDEDIENLFPDDDI